MTDYQTLRPKINPCHLEMMHHPQIEWLHFKLMLFNLHQTDHQFGQAIRRLRTIAGGWDSCEEYKGVL